jgi:hypothetical protein
MLLYQNIFRGRSRNFCRGSNFRGCHWSKWGGGAYHCQVGGLDQGCEWLAGKNAEEGTKTDDASVEDMSHLWGGGLNVHIENVFYICEFRVGVWVKHCRKKGIVLELYDLRNLAFKIWQPDPLDSLICTWYCNVFDVFFTTVTWYSSEFIHSWF